LPTPRSREARLVNARAAPPDGDTATDFGAATGDDFASVESGDVLTPTAPPSAYAAALRESALFRGLPEALIDRVLAHAVERRMRERDILFFKGDPSDHLGIVLDGTLYKILYGPKGQELILDAIETGELTDEMALVENRPRSVTAIAYGPVRVLSIPRRCFLTLREEPALMQRVHALMYERLRKSIDAMEIMCLHRLESRLARHLLSTIDAETAARGVADVALPPTQSILAAMVNASRPKLNAQLQKWQRTGLISCAGNTVRIHDVDALRGKACLGKAERTGAAREASSWRGYGDVSAAGYRSDSRSP